MIQDDHANEFVIDLEAETILITLLCLLSEHPKC